MNDKFNGSSYSSKWSDSIIMQMLRMIALPFIGIILMIYASNSEERVGGLVTMIIGIIIWVVIILFR